MIKILHLVHSLNPEAGGVVSVLKQMSHTGTIVSLDDPKSLFLKDSLCPLIGLGPSFSNYGYATRLVPWINAHWHNFDAAVVHGLWQYHGLGLLRSNIASSFPLYLMPHGMMDCYFERLSWVKRTKKAIYWRLFEHHLRDRSRAILFTSAQEQEQSKNYLNNFLGKQIIVPIGIKMPDVNIEATRFTFYKAYPRLKSKRLIVFFGRIHPKKGIDMLIQSWKTVCSSMHLDDKKNTELVIIGPHSSVEAAYYARLKQMAIDCEAPITFISYLDRYLKWGALAAADFFILPSHQENFAVAVVEALAMGTPVLISTEVNIGPTIVESQAGLVQPDNLEGTITLLQSALNTTTSQHVAWRKRAQQAFHNHFNLNFMHNTLETIIQHDLKNSL